MGLRDRIKSLREKLRRKKETTTTTTIQPSKTSSIRVIDYGTKDTAITGSTTIQSSTSSGGRTTYTSSSSGRTPRAVVSNIDKQVSQLNINERNRQVNESIAQQRARNIIASVRTNNNQSNNYGQQGQFTIQDTGRKFDANVSTRGKIYQVQVGEVEGVPVVETKYRPSVYELKRGANPDRKATEEERKFLEDRMNILELEKEKTFQDKVKFYVPRILEYPEKKIIQPVIQKIRETEGTQLVFTGGLSGGLRTEASARISGKSYVKTPFNLAGVVDIGSFFVPIVGQARAITYTSSVGGKIINDPSFVVKHPLQTIGAVGVGVSQVIGSSSKIISKIKLKEISKLESSEIGFIQQIDKNTGITNFFAQRGYKGLKQEIEVIGLTKKIKSNNPSVQSSRFEGVGVSVTSGKFSDVLGLNTGRISYTEFFKAFGKGSAKEIGNIGSIKKIGQFGASGIKPFVSVEETTREFIVGGGINNLLSFETSVGFKGFKKSDKVSLIKSPTSIGISVVSASSKPSKYIGGKTGTKSLSIEQEAVSISQNVQKLKTDVKVKTDLPNFPKITGVVKNENTPQTITTEVIKPVVKTSQNIKESPIQKIDVGGISTTITKPDIKSRSKGRSGTDSLNSTKQVRGVVSDVVQDTLQKQQSKTQSRSLSISKSLSQSITPNFNAGLTINTFKQTKKIKLPPFRIKRFGNKIRTPRGITAEVRRYGKFSPVGSLSSAQSIVTGTLGATYRVKGRGAKNLRTPKGFRKKITPEGTLFIEKRKYRLSKKGEKKEIQKAKRRKKK